MRRADLQTRLGVSGIRREETEKARAHLAACQACTISSSALLGFMRPSSAGALHFGQTFLSCIACLGGRVRRGEGQLRRERSRVTEELA